MNPNQSTTDEPKPTESEDSDQIENWENEGGAVTGDDNSDED